MTRIKQITVPISSDDAQSQQTKISLKSLEGDLDGMVKDINRHISGAATIEGAETLTNKTLTAPTLETPTINSPTLATPSVSGLQNFANDAAAATGGIAIGGMYRNGSTIMVRVV
jgi:hypothetical protein